MHDAAGPAAATADGGPLAPYLGRRAALGAGDLALDGSWLDLADDMDHAVRELTAPDVAAGGLAVVALGSYGRRQLCLHSDIDLTIVVRDERNDAPSVFRALWDAGLAVGHSIRTPAQTRAAASQRIDTACSLLDARLVAGDAALFAELEAAAAGAIRPAALLAELAAEELARRDAEPHHLQAIDLKGGRGGLRSLHALRWLAAVSGEESNGLDDAEAVLLRARQALHAGAGRAHDVLEFSLRRPAAAAVGLDAKAFLGEIYDAARRVDAAVSARFLPVWTTPPRTGRNGAVTGRLRGLARRRGDRRAEPDSVEDATTAPEPWELARDALSRDPRHPTLTPAELETIAGHDGPPWTASSRAAFVRLVCGGAATRPLLDQLIETGFVGRAIPEWLPVVSQAQLDPFHVHPVDDHLLRTAAQAVALARGDTDEPWTKEIADELGSIDEVVLGALFHDIGKGTGRDHSVAGAEIWESFATRAGFDDVTVDVVRLLVREHLLLPEVATRHDLDDPDVIAGVAARIGDADVLRMLYLVTIADALATGPDVWSSWRASLIRTLFVRTMDAIASGGSTETPMRTARIAEVSQRWSGELPAERVEQHLRDMPEAYALRTPATEVRRHLVLLDPLPDVDEARIDVVDADEWSDIALVAADRTGLLALVSGVLALSNISIREARLATRADGIVVDRLHVVDSLHAGPVDGARWPQVMAELRAALRGELALGAKLDSKHHHYRSRVDDTLEPEVRIIEGADHGTHRIELRGADRVGLLHDVSRVFQELDIDVHFAKIDTQGGRVVDTFHVHLDAAIDHSELSARLLDAAEVPG